MQIQLDQVKIKITSQQWLQIAQFKITPLSFTVIVGHNGSGKSTLSKFISQHQAPYSGKYSNDFKNISLVSLAQQQILLEQIFRDLNNDSVSPDDQGKTARQIMLENQSYPAEKLMQIANIVGITAYLDRPFKLLSTGEARKILLAKALIAEPDLLILDEPFEGLDAASQQQWLSLLHQLKQHLTIVLVINRLTDIPEWADSIALLHQCQLITQQSAAEMLNSDIFQQLCYAEEAITVPVPQAAMPAIKLPANLQTIFDLQDVVVKYGEKTILHHLNWQVKQGEHWWIKGPNGCGKSTLLSLINGDHPQAFNNKVKLFGKQRGSGETIWEIKQYIGFLSNHFHLDYRVNCSALMVIISGYFDSIGVYQHIDENIRLNALQWLKRIDMEKFANAPFRSLSWGQQRLLLIARALVKHPPILILDEPLMGLDALNRHLVLTFIDQLITNSDTQLFFVSHHQEDQPECINRIFEFIPVNDTYQYKITTI
ncbi:molybdate ABC transporter ATP-binding protein ModF [Gallibacterium salpingitidis]|uniref:molybdate ABC transporter ATP-binding protein ModF n=1 Tax=Gallibacterium salpingitidis TaxID=505341 RepID=UPI00266EEA34|nr:molybdate ABC transporter ATP-binding protein ModF [Gallibacterium salpingitidis]WKT00833.1 molybdate ABC transporter ATP-binding protein ModF [Gallibacterium salpingitidis]